MVRWLAAAAVGAWLALAAAPARADRDPPVPAGSRAAGDRHVSALGFRATADWYEKLWHRRGLVVRTVGPYRVGGVDVIRYLRDDGPWRAVHVYRVAGKTWIFVVAAPAAAPSPGSATGPIAPASGSPSPALDAPRAVE